MSTMSIRLIARIAAVAGLVAVPDGAFAAILGWGCQGQLCGRDEDIVVYRKVYRYQRENGPARNITMECMDYQLSTLAGRKGCGDD
jgi:hypothetical protein